MQNFNLWNKLYIHGQKIGAFLFLLLLVCSADGYGQNVKTTNLPNYDNRWLHYGFQIGLHTAKYQARYADAFIEDQQDSDLRALGAVMGPLRPGFSLGFIVNLRLHDQFDLRFLPQVSFDEYQLSYIPKDPDSEYPNPLPVDQTTVEFPLLLKYKSIRRGNTRMYLIGGVAASVLASNNKKEEINFEEELFVKNTGLSLELGVGLDQYFPLFKFAPELRYSLGLTNVLGDASEIPDELFFSKPLKSLKIHKLTLYLNFE
ncbi:porin family protein [Xanthovirga aplysinae]|uniref:type IX secretion/gliding motility protein PorT/SprT n=1 Tax=Xanthovirga aplysinae TaxID=2529853 RepID=UPI0012BCF8A6|nr:porin family protein [Xanthovirga aplysinae]MTI30940.1 PorT family protein [Xanthovirga aplysinae]